MTLRRYHEKRDFGRTPEPRGESPRGKGAGRFVIQKHAATRLHYDFRLELDGVLKSWAVPKGPSLDPGDRRLAVHVEDHPVEYGSFEGAIPRGEYGGGTVVLWDRGTWHPEGDPAAAYTKGHLRFRLDGEKLQGGFSLVRMHGRGDRHDNWLLIKTDDDEASDDGEALVRDRPESVATGRTLDDIAADPGRVWHSKSAARAAKKTVARRALVAKTGERPAARAKKTTKTTSAKKAAAKKTAARAKKTTKTTSAEKSSARTKKTTTTSAKSTTARKTAARTKKTAASARKTTKTTAAKETARATTAETTGKPIKKPPLDGRDAAPDDVAPELATLVDVVPPGDEWLHEIKYDGYRLLARIDGGAVRLMTRKQEDWAPRFPWLVDALRAQIPVDAALVDGELVHLGADGVTRFGALQQALSTGDHRDLVFYAFDLLHLQGVDMRRVPLLHRKQALAELLAAGRSSRRIRLSDHVLGEGERLLGRACKLGLEGVIAKRVDSPYRSGRHRDWLKIKCAHRQEVVVGGFNDSRSGPRKIGSLLIGVHDDKRRFVYCGKVGSGFDFAGAAELRARLDELVTPRHPFTTRPPGSSRSTWVRPEIVVDVEFTEWTADGRLRHPVFVGVREDKRARDVRRERPPEERPAPAKRAAPRPAAKTPKTPTGKPGAVEVLGVSITHPERVLYPDDALTKLDVARYHEALAERTLREVAGRPLSVVRCPDGIAGIGARRCFFQKHLPYDLPPGLHTARLDEHEPYLFVKDARGLVALTQVGVLELHAWGSTVAHPDEPDRLVLDLDPGPGVPWARVKDTAAALRARLADLDLASFLKTTGGKGLHVVVPLTRGRQTWDDVKAFARGLALELVHAAPDMFTASASKAGRGGKIYLDYLRNSRGATSIAAYSPRARPGAPVAVPLRWDELAALSTPHKYDVTNIHRRLASLKRDPWAELARTRQSLRAALLREVRERAA